MVDDDKLLKLAILGGVALALYIYMDSANASVDTSGGSDLWAGLDAPSVDSGFDIGSFFGWGADTQTTVESPNVDSEANPGIDFGILSDMGAIVTGWKTGEYPKYASAIRDAESRYGIPADLLARLLYQESRYRADVIAGYKRSPVGALGIAQFMPKTAADMGLTLVAGSYNGQPTQTYDPFASIDKAGAYLKKLHGQLGDWRNSLVAYNWGIGNVQKWLHGDTYIVGGVEKSYNPPPESVKYLAQITADVPVIG